MITIFLGLRGVRQSCPENSFSQWTQIKKSVDERSGDFAGQERKTVTEVCLFGKEKWGTTVHYSFLKAVSITCNTQVAFETFHCATGLSLRKK